LTVERSAAVTFRRSMFHELRVGTAFFTPHETLKVSFRAPRRVSVEGDSTQKKTGARPLGS